VNDLALFTLALQSALFPALSGVALIASTFTAEKENGTIIPLLASPVRDIDIVVGKLLGMIIPVFTLCVGSIALYYVLASAQYGTERVSAALPPEELGAVAPGGSATGVPSPGAPGFDDPVGDEEQAPSAAPRRTAASARRAFTGHSGGGRHCVLVLTLAAQDTTTFRTGINVVVAPTVVTNRQGDYINGLQPQDFQLTDNGKPQQIKVDVTYVPISLVVAIQANSAAEPVLSKIQKVSPLFQGLVTGDKGEVAIMAFDHRIQLLQDFTSDGVKIDEARSFWRSGRRRDRPRQASPRGSPRWRRSPPWR
jgi:hypothetical protein